MHYCVHKQHNKHFSFVYCSISSFIFPTRIPQIPPATLRLVDSSYSRALRRKPANHISQCPSWPLQEVRFVEIQVGNKIVSDYTQLTLTKQSKYLRAPHVSSLFKGCLSLVVVHTGRLTSRICMSSDSSPFCQQPETSSQRQTWLVEHVTWWFVIHETPKHQMRSSKHG